MEFWVSTGVQEVADRLVDQPGVGLEYKLSPQYYRPYTDTSPRHNFGPRQWKLLIQLFRHFGCWHSLLAKEYFRPIVKFCVSFKIQTFDRHANFWSYMFSSLSKKKTYIITIFCFGKIRNYVVVWWKLKGTLTFALLNKFIRSTKKIWFKGSDTSFI